ncbi:MAG: efflux transporter periplasmic adaptor subunit, partial [Rhodobacteraceae bacterium]|nr:efflux transporter periplasmic adaptor subunit [Paracoccaceae bacterium]
LLRRQGDDVIIAPVAAAGREIVAERSALLGAGIRITPNRPGLVTLTEARRAALIARVEAASLDAAEKTEILAQLAAEQVPVALVERFDPPAGG